MKHRVMGVLSTDLATNNKIKAIIVIDGIPSIGKVVVKRLRQFGQVVSHGIFDRCDNMALVKNAAVRTLLVCAAQGTEQSMDSELESLVTQCRNPPNTQKVAGRGEENVQVS